MVRVANAKKVDWRQLQNSGANLAKMVEYHAGKFFRLHTNVIVEQIMPQYLFSVAKNVNYH